MRAIRVTILVVSLFRVVGLSASSAMAAPVTWGAAQNISGVADVNTTGRLVNAYSFGNATSPTVNGVTFTGTYASTAAGNLPTGISATSGISDGWVSGTTTWATGLGHSGLSFGYGSITDRS